MKSQAKEPIYGCAHFNERRNRDNVVGRGSYGRFKHIFRIRDNGWASRWKDSHHAAGYDLKTSGAQHSHIGASKCYLLR